MPQTDLDKALEKELEKRKLNEINSKLDKIVRNTEEPGLGTQLYHAYDNWNESKTKEIRAGIEKNRREQSRSKKVGLAQDILGSGLVLIGALMYVFNHDTILLGIGLVIVGGIIIRL